MWEISCCFLFLIIFTRWILPLQEARCGLQSFQDPILCHLPNFDTSRLVGIMSFLLPSLLCIDSLIYSDQPVHLKKALIVYTCVLVTKCVTMYVAPFDVPNGYIPLVDLISKAATKTAKSNISRDLMFSGHTSMALICTLAIAHPVLRYLSALLTALMVLCLLINRVHYTIDVIVAFFVTFTWSTILKLL